MEHIRYVGDLLYSFYRLKLRPKRSVDLISVDPAQEVFPVCSMQSENDRAVVPCWASPIRACAVLAPGMSLPRKLGGSSPGKEELNTCRIPATAKWKGESSSAAGSICLQLPSRSHINALFSPHLDQNCQRS